MKQAMIWSAQTPHQAVLKEWFIAKQAYGAEHYGCLEWIHLYYVHRYRPSKGGLQNEQDLFQESASSCWKDGWTLHQKEWKKGLFN